MLTINYPMLLSSCKQALTVKYKEIIKHGIPKQTKKYSYT